MQFGLTRLVLGSPSFLSITEEDYQKIFLARQFIGEALNLEQKFDFIVENYVEFEETLFKSGIHDVVLGGRGYQWFHINRGVFDRRIMNFLTTSTSYSDSAKHHLSLMFQGDSRVVSKLMNFYSHEYDSRIGYRAMCKLRNFVQHQGLPVHGSSYNSRWIEQDGIKRALNRNTVDPYLSIDELRKGKFNRTVLAELEKLGDNIDLKFLVRDYMEGLSIAHSRMRAEIVEELDKFNNVLEDAFKSFQDRFPMEESLIGLSAVKRLDTGSLHDRMPIIREPGEYREYLLRKNPSMINLTKMYVSSEVVQKLKSS